MTFQITLSKNIADAKKIIEDEDYQFDVMLIDLIMPGTMDLIRQIKKNKRIVTSSYCCFNSKR